MMKTSERLIWSENGKYFIHMKYYHGYMFMVLLHMIDLFDQSKKKRSALTKLLEFITLFSSLDHVEGLCCAEHSHNNNGIFI
jgi:hypothetical protein